MRTIDQLLYSEKSDMTGEELVAVHDYINGVARYSMDSYDYCCLLGWYVLGDWNIPLSTKEAGFD